jgi:PleD family two-component response regulator
MHVAERIRQTLRVLTLVSPRGENIPAPTVSQGIAMLSEVGSPEELVDLADQRLYIAKERGRNQIEPQASHWETIDAGEFAS